MQQESVSILLFLRKMWPSETKQQKDFSVIVLWVSWADGQERNLLQGQQKGARLLLLLFAALIMDRSIVYNNTLKYAFASVLYIYYLPH